MLDLEWKSSALKEPRATVLSFSGGPSSHGLMPMSRRCGLVNHYRQVRSSHGRTFGVSHFVERDYEGPGNN